MMFQEKNLLPFPVQVDIFYKEPNEDVTTVQKLERFSTIWKEENWISSNIKDYTSWSIIIMIRNDECLE